MRGFADNSFSVQTRRVRIDSVSDDGTETWVSDGTGWRTMMDGSIRPKGTPLPEPNEIWIIERYATTWLLKAQERAAEPQLDGGDLSDLAAEVERQLAEQAAHEALRAAKEAALAAGIMDGDAVILIQSAPPGVENQNTSTLWIDTTNDLNRPMRWESGQWVVVVDVTAMEAARRAVAAQQAAEAAEARAAAAEAAAAAAQAAAAAAQAASQAAIDELADVQEALVGVQGKIDGKSTIYPVGSSPDLGPEDVGDMRLLADGGVEYWDGTQWLPADPRVAAAVTEAALALGLVNTKITTYYKAIAPTVSDIEAPETEFTIGDLWLRSGDNRLHRWDGTAWVEFKDAAINILEGLVTDLGDDLTGLEGKVDGKSTIYVQDTAPVDVSGTEDIGDLWIDTAGGGRVYKSWDGTQWVLADDPRVTEVLDTVSTKITTYYGTTEPTGTVQVPLVTGDLWLRSPDNRTFRFDGANWVDVGDTRIGDHENRLSLVQDALVEMDGKIDGKAVVWFQPVDPSLNASPAWDIAQMGDIWIDTSVPGQTTYKVWDSNSWEVITDPAALAALERVDSRMVTYFANGTTGPEGPNFPPPEGYVTGDLWIRTSDKMIFRWDGTSWVDATFIDSRVGEQETNIATLQGELTGLSGRIDGKATIYYQPSAPTDLRVEDKGDIWIDSDADPKTFQSWSGVGWVDVTDPTALAALAGLDKKSTTYFATGTTAPTGIVPAPTFVVGDLWVHTTTKVLRRYDGANWVDITDPRLTSATAAIGVLQSDLSALDGKVDGRAIVYYQATDPKNLPTTWGSDQTGDIWINTSGATTVYNVWTGAAWRVITDPVATQALSTVQTKTTTYYKATKPILSDIQAPETAFRLGDLWIRTSDNRLHRYNGTDFLEVADTRIGDQAAAIAAIQTNLGNLSTTVDGKAVIWFQPSAPTGLVAEDAGDIWINSDAVPRTFKSWDGGDWVDVTDQTALDALAGLDSKVTTYYATEKAGPAPDLAFVNQPPNGFTEGDLWVNSSKGNSIYRYPGTGTAWALLALGKEAISASARDLGGVVAHASINPPTNPLNGDLWIDMALGNVLKRYDGGNWVAVQDSAIQSAITAATNAQSTADGKVRIFSQNTAPTGLLPEDKGDMWINPSEDHRIYLWTDSGAVPTPGAVDQVNYVLNPVPRATGASWSAFGSAQVTPTKNYYFTQAQYAPDAFPRSYVRVTAAATGTMGIRAPLGPVSGTISAAIWVRRAGLVNYSLRLRLKTYTSDGTLSVDRIGTAVAVSLFAQAARLTALDAVVPTGGYATLEVETTDSVSEGAQFDAGAAVVSSGTAAPIYLDGSLPDTETDQYGWGTSPPAEGTQHDSPSYHLPITQSTGFAWVPQPLGTEALGPIDAGETIIPGTVSADLFQTQMLLADKTIVTGDPDGSATEIQPTGISIYTTGDDSRVRRGYLGHEGDQFLMLSSADGTPMSGFNADGDLLAAGGEIKDDFTVKGRMLLGSLADPTYTGPSWLGNHARGTVAWGDFDAANPSGPVNTGTTTNMVGYLTFPVKANRRYRFSMLYGIRVSNATATGRVGVQVPFTFSATGTPSTPVTESPKLAEMQHPVPGWNQALYSTMNFFWNSTQDGTMSVGLTLQSWTCDAELHRGATEAWKLYVDDEGAWNNIPDLAVAPTAPAKRRYTTIWTPSGVRQYQGSTQSTGTWNGTPQTNKMAQGSGGSYAVRHAVAAFTGNSVAGDRRGISITTALGGGAVVESVELRMTSSVQVSSRVDVRVGWQNSWTAAPVGRVFSPLFSLGSTKQFDLGADAGAFLKASTGNRYITTGPGVQGDVSEYIYLHGMDSTFAKNMQLIITYVK